MPVNIDSEGKKIYFPRVKEAREALKEKALAILAKYEMIIDEAIASGRLDVAAEHTQWLIEHMPTGDGETIIDSSAAKPKASEAKSLPAVQIGIALGGVTTPPKSLPSVEVIDVTDDKSNDSEQ